MINNYPLIHIGKKEHLEEFQQGSLFMHTNLYYQQMTNDSERADKYDGSICTENIPDYLMKAAQNYKMTNPRLVLGNCYIKSFFQFNDEEVKRIGQNAYKYTLSERSKGFFKELKGVDSVLIIFDIKGFINQFIEACARKKLKYWYANIQYMTREQMNIEGQKFIALKKDSKCMNPVFIKSVDYCNQQEFRLCVQHSMDVNIDKEIKSKHIVKIDKSIADLPYNLDIGKIDEYSTIMPLNDLVGHSLLVDNIIGVFSIE